MRTELAGEWDSSDFSGEAEVTLAPRSQMLVLEKGRAKGRKEENQGEVEGPLLTVTAQPLTNGSPQVTCGRPAARRARWHQQAELPF